MMTIRGKKRTLLTAALLACCISIQVPAAQTGDAAAALSSGAGSSADTQVTGADAVTAVDSTSAAGEQTQTQTESAVDSQGTGSANASEKDVQLKGLKTVIKKAVSAKAVIKDPVTISPAHACKVKLQYYQSSTGKWKTAKTYTIKKGAGGKLTLKYTSYWKRAKITKWRVSIPASDGYKKYTSPTVTVTSTRPASPKLSIGSKSAVVIRASDGYVIYGKNKNKKLPNASTTKMMTALLTIEKGNLDSITTISKKAAATGWGCLYATAGMKFKVRDLLNVMLVHSSNDAASCLAEYNAGTVKKFAKKMTARARQLGAKNTNFVNPHGLHNAKHYSSAYDLAMIQRECIRHQTYLNIVKKRSYSFSSASKPKVSYSFYTTDDLLGYDSGFLGGKTGYTEEAGLCFCGIYRYQGVNYIFTVLGNVSSAGRWNDCKTLIQFIRKNYK